MRNISQQCSVLILYYDMLTVLDRIVQYYFLFKFIEMFGVVMFKAHNNIWWYFAVTSAVVTLLFYALINCVYFWLFVIENVLLLIYSSGVVVVCVRGSKGEEKYFCNCFICIFMAVYLCSARRCQLLYWSKTSLSCFWCICSFVIKTHW